MLEVLHNVAKWIVGNGATALQIKALIGWVEHVFVCCHGDHNMINIMSSKLWFLDPPTNDYYSTLYSLPTYRSEDGYWLWYSEYYY